MSKRINTPIYLIFLGAIIVAVLTVLYGFGISSNNIFLKSGCIVGNIILVIQLCNLSYKKGFEENKK